MTTNLVPAEPDHDDYDTDVPDVDLLVPDYEAEEVEEIVEQVEPIPLYDLNYAAPEED